MSEFISKGRLSALIRRKAAVERAIDQEHARPSPCGFTLQTLKRKRLALKESLQRLRRRNERAFAS